MDSIGNLLENPNQNGTLFSSSFQTFFFGLMSPEEFQEISDILAINTDLDEVFANFMIFRLMFTHSMLDANSL